MSTLRLIGGVKPGAVKAASPVLNGGDEETGLFRPRLVATQLESGAASSVALAETSRCLRRCVIRRSPSSAVVGARPAAQREGQPGAGRGWQGCHLPVAEGWSVGQPRHHVVDTSADARRRCGCLSLVHDQYPSMHSLGTDETSLPQRDWLTGAWPDIVACTPPLCQGLPGCTTPPARAGGLPPREGLTPASSLRAATCRCT
jgi:hypothetical protein